MKKRLNKSKFININYYGVGKNDVTIYEDRLKQPFNTNINIDAIERISPCKENELIIMKDNGSTYKIKCKFFVITTISEKIFFVPGDEYHKFIK